LSTSTGVAWSNFKKYYHDLYPLQSLTLLPHLGEAEVVYHPHGSSVITLQVDTAQMIVLELFNEDTTLSLQQLATNSGLPIDMLNDTVQSLTKKICGM